MDIQQYKQMLEQPWGKIQYEITFAQLVHLKNKKILEVRRFKKLPQLNLKSVAQCKINTLTFNEFSGFRPA